MGFRWPVCYEYEKVCGAQEVVGFLMVLSYRANLNKNLKRCEHFVCVLEE